MDIVIFAVAFAFNVPGAHGPVVPLCTYHAMYNLKKKKKKVECRLKPTLLNWRFVM